MKLEDVEALVVREARELFGRQPMNRLEEAEKKVMNGSLVSVAAKTGSVVIDPAIRYRFIPHGPIDSYEIKQITREQVLEILGLGSQLEGDN